MKAYFIFLILLTNVVYGANIVLVPDADLATNSWTTTPLFSKVDDSASSPDGLNIISPAGADAGDFINFSLAESVEGEALEVTISVVANTTALLFESSQINISWFASSGSLIASENFLGLTTEAAQYTSTKFSISVNRTQINSSFLLVIPNTGLDLEFEQIAIDSINLNITTRNTTLIANGSIVGFTSNITGENITYQGGCQALGLSSANNVHLILQSSTDNVTFTTISTSTTASIYANVSSYFFDTLTNQNSSTPKFHVNATRPGTYTLRSQCNGTNTSPKEANNTGANFTPSQAWGFLNVTFTQPNPLASNTNVAKDQIFVAKANVTCQSLTFNPTAICGRVNGSPSHNITGGLGEETFEVISEVPDDKPFWSPEVDMSCGLLNESNTCELSWDIYATGDIGDQHKIAALFSSENVSFVPTGFTSNYGNVTAVNCLVDFTLFGYLDFETLLPNPQPSAAPDNAGGGYPITVSDGSCETDFYIKGTNLTNSSYSNVIGVSNISWSNASNTYSTSKNLTGSDVLFKEDRIGGLEPTFNIWFWIRVPPVFAGIYNGTITITGVESV